MAPSKGTRGQVSVASDLERSLRNLRWWNIAVGLVLGAQAIVIASLQNGFSVPVVATWLNGPPGTVPETHKIGDFYLGWAVFAFTALSALALLLMASPGVFQWYKRNLLQSRNYGRWIEYSVTASLMAVLITMICGALDLAAILAVFWANACMILFGLLMEKYERPGNPSWLPYLFGCFAGLVPWIIVLIYIWSPGYGALDPPRFVYGIIFSLFVFFNSFAANMVLQYKKIGPWRDYLFGEKVYILLSLTAKSALAWQVFGSVLTGAVEG